MTPLRTAALEAVTARLAAVLPVPVERARRAAVDTDREELPRLVVMGEGWTANEAVEPLVTHYTIGFAVMGYAAGDDDQAAEDAVSLLHAQTVAALSAWTPAAAGLGDVSELEAELVLFEAEQSARPAGMFTARFSILATVPSGAPYSP